MAKKKSNKPAKTKPESNGKPGKIERADEMLLSGKFTKSQVAEAIRKEFGMPEKTARNTTSWAASTIGTRHAGKVSKHLPEDKAADKPARKPAKIGKSAKSAKSEKKSIPSRKPKTEAAAPVKAPVTTPETPAA